MVGGLHIPETVMKASENRQPGAVRVSRRIFSEGVEILQFPRVTQAIAIVVYAGIRQRAEEEIGIAFVEARRDDERRGGEDGLQGERVH